MIRSMAQGSAAAAGSVLLVVAVAGCPIGQRSYFEGWEGGVAAWQANTINTVVTFMTSGGAPNGYLHSVATSGDTAGGLTREAAALQAISGGATSCTVSINCLHIDGSFTGLRFRVRYQDAGYNGWYMPLPPPTPQGTWISYTFSFSKAWTDAEAQAEGWVREAEPSASFSQTMSDPYTVEIRAIGAGVEMGIDNVRITSH